MQCLLWQDTRTTLTSVVVAAADIYSLTSTLFTHMIMALQEIQQEIDIDNWENKRGPRPWENNEEEGNNG